MKSRRTFIRRTSSLALGFWGLKSLTSCHYLDAQSSAFVTDYAEVWAEGYGTLQKDKKGILKLPKGFSYKIISRRGDKMSDGLIVPGLADGMATFPGPDGKVIIVRNHEVSPGDDDNGAFGRRYHMLHKVDGNKVYDNGRGIKPCLGGTTTIVYNPNTKHVETEYLSLAGTIRNCAGGPTPWHSWITCEEDTNVKGSILEKNHGYNFEVPASAKPQLFHAVPIKAMGRFNHEAVCVDPDTSIVYQTEDRHDGLIYRYIPNEKGQLQEGGRLQVLALRGYSSFDTRNWHDSKGERMVPGQKYQVEWQDIDNVEAPDDDLRYRGAEQGAAVFARGEGMWYSDGEAYFACTNGGMKQYGQVFRYTPSPYEGTAEELSSPGTLELFIEPNNSDLLESCDNMTIAANGDLVLCEDKSRPRIVGVTPNGKIYHIAKNIGFRSEFAGAVFSPDGSTLFVNIQGPGLTLAITGPWGERKA